jgi:predicted ester cyclase
MLENVALFARIIQGGVSVVLLTGVVIAYLSWRSKQNLDRRASALSYSLTRNKDYFEARSAIEMRFRDFFKEKKPATAEQVQEIISQEKEIATKLKYILAHWEIMAISIFDDLIDEKTCFEMVGSTLVNTVEVMEPYMMELRNNPLNRRRYDYLLVLYNEWKARIAKMEKSGTISRFDQYRTNGNDLGKLRRKLQSDLKEW